MIMAHESSPRGILVIVSSPSGAGKTTLTRRLLQEFPNLTFSVSYTTRAMRTGEVDGRDYHFVSNATFDQMVERGEFAEHFYVHGNHYGTASAPVEAALAAGRDMIFDVDWQGGAALSAQWENDCLKIFILPPDLKILAQRLRSRATDSAEVIERRLRKALEELGHYSEYEHLIVNDELERSYPILRAIYLTRRFRWSLASEAPAAPDAPASEKDTYDLRRLEELVQANRQSGAIEHARLLATGVDRAE
jgi:guanylate kinase